eukprot:scaffold1218_cov393-Prasinococcus_capsulatus_cf.AAC.8
MFVPMPLYSDRTPSSFTVRTKASHMPLYATCCFPTPAAGPPPDEALVDKIFVSAVFPCQPSTCAQCEQPAVSAHVVNLRVRTPSHGSGRAVDLHSSTHNVQGIGHCLSNGTSESATGQPAEATGPDYARLARLVDGEVEAHVGDHTDYRWQPAPKERAHALLARYAHDSVPDAPILGSPSRLGLNRQATADHFDGVYGGHCQDARARPCPQARPRRELGVGPICAPLEVEDGLAELLIREELHRGVGHYAQAVCAIPLEQTPHALHSIYPAQRAHDPGCPGVLHLVHDLEAFEGRHGGARDATSDATSDKALDKRRHRKLLRRRRRYGLVWVPRRHAQPGSGRRGAPPSSLALAASTDRVNGPIRRPPQQSTEEPGRASGTTCSAAPGTARPRILKCSLRAFPQPSRGRTPVLPRGQWGAWSLG